MRHRVKGRKLGRTASHREATLRALALAIIENKEIKTTLAKAKEARRVIERLITYSKKDTLHARRLAYKMLNRHDAVKQLFDEIGPTYEGRNGGYTRIIKLGQRIGDGAEMAILQLVGFESMPEMVEPAKPSKKKSAKKTSAKEETKVEEKAAKVEASENIADEKEESAEAEAVEEKKEEKPEEPVEEKEDKADVKPADQKDEPPAEETNTEEEKK